jgi:crotonobetainyl-CoA:carnitine CoA-transferase CaiB-like acyl-CoA transferase
MIRASASHAYLNRNKRSLALDLKQAEALEIVRAGQGLRHCARAFRPG